MCYYLNDYPAGGFHQLGESGPLPNTAGYRCAYVRGRQDSCDSCNLENINSDSRRFVKAVASLEEAKELEKAEERRAAKAYFMAEKHMSENDADNAAVLTCEEHVSYEILADPDPA